MSDRAKDTEILALRHRITVLETATRCGRALSAVNADTDTLTGLRGTVGTLVDRYELRDGCQHPRQRSELYALAAQSSGLLSYMAVNAGRPAGGRACRPPRHLTQGLETAPGPGVTAACAPGLG